MSAFVREPIWVEERVKRPEPLIGRTNSAAMPRRLPGVELELGRIVRGKFSGEPPQRKRRRATFKGLRLLPLPAWKRGMDLLGAAIGLIALLPLLAAIALAIKLGSRGPVFFRQWRAGLGGKPFRIYKFRTMIEGAERLQGMLEPMNSHDGPVFKMENDPRLTRLGQFLRKTSLDELPQLWNVLRGEMSLVGPRPLDCRESEACEPWQLRRLEATPGITGLWQISGRSDVAFDDWVRMDLRYIRQRGLWMDLYILLKTIPAVVSRRGAR